MTTPRIIVTIGGVSCTYTPTLRELDRRKGPRRKNLYTRILVGNKCRRVKQ